MIKIAFTGNPNTGKSALINAIAGAKLRVGNWPGVTVEKKEAHFQYEGEEVMLVDLPGVYSLSPYTLEEKITRDFILHENPDVVVNVVDSTNLERNLYLSSLLKELGRPMIMALNFYDEFTKLDYQLDFSKFTDLIEYQAIPTSALKKTGMKELMDKALELYRSGKKTAVYKLPFQADVLQELTQIQKKLETEEKYAPVLGKYGKDYAAIKLLERDSWFRDTVLQESDIDFSNFAEEHIKKLEEKYDNDIETILAEQRYGVVNGILKQSLSTSLKSRLDFTEKVDKVLLNKYLGLPLFLLIISGIMGFVFNGSAPFIDWVDGFFGDFVGKYVGILVEGTPDWVQALVVDGIVGGVGGVLTFVPLMTLLYFFLAVLEESGYMNRVAFIMDKIMRKVGLNGKAFVPMVIGFGCSVPSIYATRTLEDENSRRLTAAVSPFMSCGARLPVYGLFTAAFFGANAGLAVASLYLFGILVAVATGMFLNRFKQFKTENRALLIELPPYRIPSLGVIFKSTWSRLKEYLQKATTIILGVLVLLWALTYFPNDGDAKESYMAKIGNVIAPVLQPTGFANRWEPVAAIVPSIAAKEVVVGFMAQVLPEEEVNAESPDMPEEMKAGATVKKSTEEAVSTEGDAETEVSEEEEEETSFGEDLTAQMVGLGEAVRDSFLGMIDVRNIAGLFEAPDEETLAEENGSGLIQATRNLWAGDPLGSLRAYSFMVFILLVVPCVVTLAAIKQEFGWKFLAFVTALMLVIPYVASTLVFQIGKLFL